MRIELRIDALTMKASSLESRWMERFARPRPTRTLGVLSWDVVAGSPEHLSLRAFLKEAKREWNVNTDQLIRVRYSAEDVAAAELLVMFPPIRTDCVKAEYLEGDACAHCGRVLPWQLRSVDTIRVDNCAGLPAVSDGRDVVLVRDDVRKALQARASGAQFGSDIPREGTSTTDYSVLTPEGVLRGKITRRLRCPVCGVGLRRSDEPAEPFEVYHRDINIPLADVSLTDHFPRLLVVSAWVRELLQQTTQPIPMENFIPVYWECPPEIPSLELP